MANLGVLAFIKAAHAMLHADTSSMEGFERFLVSWYCFKYNVPPNDSNLLDMTLEELATLYFMHRIKEDPNFVAETVSGKDDYEEWLKQEMGEDYISNEEMVKQMVEYEKEQIEKRTKDFKQSSEDLKAAVKSLKDLPDRITTQFKSSNPED
jgi:hypothetical protein